MSNNKKKWKESQKIAPRMKDGISKNAIRHSKDATKMSKKAFKNKKKEYKLARNDYKKQLKEHKFSKKNGKPLSINHIIAKRNFLKEKNNKIVSKRIYQKTKATDKTRLNVKIKGEIKQSVKQDLKFEVAKILQQDDTLGEGSEAYRKADRSRRNMRLGLRVGKNAGKLSVKTIRGTRSLGSRFVNLSKGRGFHPTPKDLTTKKQLMIKFRNIRQRMKVAKAAKKANSGLGMLRSLLNGKQTVGKALQLLLKNPYTLGIILVILIIFMLVGVAGATQKPAIVQNDEDLTNSWLYMTKIDADNTDDTNQFFSNIDDVMFYMNYQFEEYKVTDSMDSGMQTYENYLSKLWTALNGNAPDFSLKTMNELETDQNSDYYFSGEDYDHYLEVKQELGYTTLEDTLAFPFKTDSLIVSRRFGYEKKDGNNQLYNGIELMTESNKEFNSPLSGKITNIPNENSIVIEVNKRVRLTIEGVKSGRFKINDTIQEGSYLGGCEKEIVTIYYEKYNSSTKEWYSVNPAFYFPSVTYTQATILGSSDFSPNGDVEARAIAVYDYLTKLGYKKEGIAAILGNFSVESGINPKRAEGDYMTPPVGASANSWDDSNWLSLGGLAIYGKYPNILHRGLGLGQWTDTADGGTRHTLLLKYAKSKSKKWYDLELQLDFIFNGDSPGYRRIASNVAGNVVSSNVSELTVYFLNTWEGNPGDKVTERIQAAQNWYNYLSNIGNEVNGNSSEVFQQYKDKMTPLPTDKETKEGKGWSGNAYQPGNCTWYVYNRMKQLGKQIHPTMGNANQWIVNYSQTVGAKLVTDPQRGDIVIFSNGVAGASSVYGHVAFVEYVNSDGTFVVSEMNVNGLYSMNWRVLKKVSGEYFMRVN